MAGRGAYPWFRFHMTRWLAGRLQARFVLNVLARQQNKTANLCALRRCPGASSVALAGLVEPAPSVELNAVTVSSARCRGRSSPGIA